MSKTTNNLYFLFLFSFLTLFTSCDPGGGGGGGEVLLFNTDDEKNLGEAIHKAMINSDNFNIMPESMDTNNYIKSIRTRLIATNLMEHRQDFEWNLYVILNDDVQDCFATVGGNIYIYSGLMKTLNNEAQFMGIVAHEFYYADNHYHTNILRGTYPIARLLEASRGNDEVLAIEMLQSFYDTPRDPVFVGDADSYGMGIICFTDAYAPEVPVAVENTYQSNNMWYNNHKQLNSQPIASRILSLENYARTGCGLDKINEVPYQAFLNKLP